MSKTPTKLQKYQAAALNYNTQLLYFSVRKIMFFWCYVGPCCGAKRYECNRYKVTRVLHDTFGKMMGLVPCIASVRQGACKVVRDEFLYLVSNLLCFCAIPCIPLMFLRNTALPGHYLVPGSSDPAIVPIRASRNYRRYNSGNRH